MNARPRKVSDEEVFGAVMRVMHRVAPAQVTLTEIAAEAGVTPSALVPRVGSRRELLLEVLGQAAEGTAEYFARLRRASVSPLAALQACAGGVAEWAVSPGPQGPRPGY